MTRDQIEKQIAAIDDQLNAGLTQVNVDGISASVDLEQLRRQRHLLARQLANIDGSSGSPFRPVQL